MLFCRVLDIWNVQLYWEVVGGCGLFMGGKVFLGIMWGKEASMGKDTRLVNIYIKIHNKRNLTIEDLNYLSRYDPECFEKTCRNVVYNVPDAKEVLQPGLGQEEQVSWGNRGMQDLQQMGQGSQENGRMQLGQEGGKMQQAGQGQKEMQAGRGKEGMQQTGQEQEGREDNQGEEKKKDLFAPEKADKKQIEAALSNLKQMEQEGLPVGEMDVDTVKNLLGNLYMEMLFPHNGRTRFFNMEDQEYRSVFNKKV